MIVVLAGHVDHGKTSLVQAITGVNTDSLAEEKRRGLSIDLGFAYADLGGQRIGFVDVPGHHRFIQNMIAGVAENQHALLVIAADDGVMPQTIEHLQILSLLGIKQGTVAITKTDLVSQDRLNELRDELRFLFEGSCLQGSQIIETSTQNGTGIPKLLEAIQSCAEKHAAQSESSCFRLAIDRSFSLAGQGTVVTGTVNSGNVSIGEFLHHTGTNQRVRVRNLHVNDSDAESAHAGDRCGINLAGIDSKDIHRGTWLCAEEGLLATDRFFLQLEVVSDFQREVKHWHSVHVYHATSHAEGHLGLLGGPRLKRDESAIVEVTCSDPIHVKIGDRVIIRDRDLQGTIGGGEVRGIPQEKRKSRVENRIWRQALSSEEPQHMTKLLTQLARHEVVDLDHFRRSWNVPADQFAESIESTDLMQADTKAMESDSFNRLAAQVKRVLQAFHKSHPDLPGANFERLHQQISSETRTLRFVLEYQVNSRTLKLNQGQYALNEFRQSKFNFDEGLFRRIEPLVNRPHPMSLGDLSKELRVPLSRLDQESKKMARAGVVIRISDRRLIHPTQLDKFVSLARELSSNQELTVARFRDKTKLGRNTVVQLLEYFDQIGLTKRVDDQRIVIKEKTVA